MNKKIKNLILVIFLLFIPFVIQAESNECVLKYGGDDCVFKIEVENTSSGKMKGDLIMDITYNDELFDGIGIKVYLKENNEWKEIEWNNTFTITNIEFNQGISNLKIKIETNPALEPGNYSFSFNIEDGESIDKETIQKRRASGQQIVYQHDTTKEIRRILQEIIILLKKIILYLQIYHNVV